MTMGLSSGSQLGRFRVVRRLGAGAMGEVYLAEDPGIERLVAIKTVRVEALEQASEEQRAQLRLRLEREAKAAGRLVHPHIVTLFEAGEIDGLFCLAFEYVDGPDLASRSRRGAPLSLAEIVRIGREAASALDAAHRVGIVHRDIKPSNMMLTADGAVKIGDFGIATLVGQGTALTQTGAVIGTPQYLSPEQVRAEVQLDGRSDLFSLGVVLYELLGGRRPFDGGSVAALVYAIVTDEPRPLAELRPDLPPRLCAAVMRLLAKERDRRFSNAAELCEELARVERELAAEADRSTEVRSDPLPDNSVVPARGRSLMLGLAVVVPLLLLAGATAGVLHLMPDPATAVEKNVRDDRAADPKGVTPVDFASRRATEPVVTETQTAAREPETVASPDRVEVPAPRVVGAVVTFRVSPQEAAERAVVKVDGLIRGLAAGSVMTLRPGRHEIEVTADGFRTETLLVESRDESTAPSEVEVSLTRQ